jgi:hypothetical protein
MEILKIYFLALLLFRINIFISHNLIFNSTNETKLRILFAVAKKLQDLFYYCSYFLP